jgi:hypothetical protein
MTHPALTSAVKPILMVTIPAVAEMFQCVVDEMPHNTNLKVIHLLHGENANHTREYLKS